MIASYQSAHMYLVSVGHRTHGERATRQFYFQSTEEEGLELQEQVHRVCRDDLNIKPEFVRITKVANVPIHTF